MIDLTKFVKAPKNKKDLSYLKRKYYNGIIRLISLYNSAVSFFSGGRFISSGSQELDEVRGRALIRTDINDHLETIFVESLKMKPKLIVELGVGPGESTFVFERVAKLSGANLISIDLNKEKAGVSSWDRWFFIESDDIAFANNFNNWCQAKKIEPNIDALFIDTSHQYEHTKKEMESWFPFLSENAIVFFHDTNVRPIYRRKDGSIGLTYDIKRGVIRALEDYFGIPFNEGNDFSIRYSGWEIRHFAFCNGLTILKR